MFKLAKSIVKILLPKALSQRLAEAWDRPWQDIRRAERARLEKNRWPKPANARNLGKASGYRERFREIVSNPLNILISRVPEAGFINSDMEVVLHNGISVPLQGPLAYSGELSEILVTNRGVHEPLEEFCFQELLKVVKGLPNELTMIELGAWWGHYSLWFSKEVKSPRCILVEPNEIHMDAGKRNFAKYGFKGEFINALVSEEEFSVDGFIRADGNKGIFLLHCDIDGPELDMLRNCRESLAGEKIDYLMIATHGNELHAECLKEITDQNYLIEVESEPARHSTSCDGFIFARRSGSAPVIHHKNLLGRVDICHSSPEELVSYLGDVLKSQGGK